MLESGFISLCSFLTSFIICYVSIPSIIKVADLKNIYDEPNARKKQARGIPNLGGIAIFAGFIFSCTFWAKNQELIEMQYIISALIILFFTGVKDDIIELVAYKKFIAQFIASIIIVYSADIRLTSLYGIFNIYDIPYWFSLILSVLTIVAITNAYNLIDGIDMLSGSIGLLTTLLFAVWFTLTGHGQYALLAFSMSGALIAFLFFNKPPASIYMGDTGSLVLGCVCAILAIKFIEFNRVYTGDISYKILSVPAVAIGVLIIPLFDTFRVFTIRIYNKKSPFRADRNHIHHILQDRGYSPKKVVITLVVINLIIILLSLLLQKLHGELLLAINILVMLLIVKYHVWKRNNA